VLNSLTEHDFHDEFKNGVGNGPYARKETISRMAVANRLKVTYDQMAASVPEIMDIPT
jgi:hypothetical protein